MLTALTVAGPESDHKGPIGLTGPAGTDGANGADGEVQGPQGPIGLTGPAGADGVRQEPSDRKDP